MRIETSFVFIGNDGVEQDVRVDADLIVCDGILSLQQVNNSGEIQNKTGLSSSRVWNEVAEGFNESATFWIERVNSEEPDSDCIFSEVITFDDGPGVEFQVVKNGTDDVRIHIIRNGDMMMSVGELLEGGINLNEAAEVVAVIGRAIEAAKNHEPQHRRRPF